MYRKENTSRLELFRKGSDVLKDWLASSEAALKEAEEKRATIESKIEELEKNIASTNKDLEKIRMEAQESQNVRKVGF